MVTIHRSRIFFYYVTDILSLLTAPTQTRKHSQTQVSLKLYSTALTTGNHNTICSKLVQLSLRKGHNYEDSQAYSQGGPQAYRCLGWRDREVVVGDVEPKVETTFTDSFWRELVGQTTSSSVYRLATITKTSSLKLCLLLLLPPQ